VKQTIKECSMNLTKLQEPEFQQIQLPIHMVTVT